MTEPSGVPGKARGRGKPSAAARPPARSLLALLAFVLGLGTVPHRVCERDAGAYFDGEASDALAASVAKWTAEELTPASFATGSSRFDGEWLFGTFMMAAMGFGQVALERAAAGGVARPGDEAVASMERCLDAMLAPGARAFDREAWGLDALASVSARAGSAEDRGHVAYLGYAGLALGLHRLVVPRSRFDATHDAIVAALARRFVASPSGLVETYPGEVYPVDNAAALGALSLHARAMRAAAAAPRSAGRADAAEARARAAAAAEAPDATNAALGRGLFALRARAVVPSSGLLAQAVDARSGAPRDPGRGSGTALAAYFLAYADLTFSASLYRAVHRELFRTIVGFGVVLEHPSSCEDCAGRVDIDSGPVVAGFGVSATGFALGASRANDDGDTFRALYATAHLFGAPLEEGRTRTYVTGGPLGDAILFAMLTAPRPFTLALRAPPTWPAPGEHGAKRTSGAPSATHSPAASGATNGAS